MTFHGKICETTETWMFSLAGIQRTGMRSSALKSQRASKIFKNFSFTQIYMFIVGTIEHKCTAHPTPVPGLLSLSLSMACMTSRRFKVQDAVP